MADTNTLSPVAAEPRARKLTFEEFVAAAEAGVFGAEARVELIEGEIVDMPPQSPAHFRFKNAIGAHFIRNAGPALSVFIEATLKIGASIGVDPDVSVVRDDAGSGQIDPASLVVVVEVAASSLDYDLRRKARLYAQAGVAEYWVVDIAARVTHVHRQRSGDAWIEARVAAFEDVLTPLAAPELAIRLADL